MLYCVEDSNPYHLSCPNSWCLDCRVFFSSFFLGEKRCPSLFVCYAFALQAVATSLYVANYSHSQPFYHTQDGNHTGRSSEQDHLQHSNRKRSVSDTGVHSCLESM